MVYYYIFYIVLAFFLPSLLVLADVSIPVDEINYRQELLKNISRSLIRNKNCDGKYVIRVQGVQYGRSGNIIITVANGLWLASLTNGLFEIPKFAESQIIDYFDKSKVEEIFCIAQRDKDYSRRRLIKMNAVEMYAIKRLYNNPELQHILPPFNKTTVKHASLIYSYFYAALWAHPKPSIVSAGKAFIRNNLNNNLNYNAVHQRSHEGHCSMLYCRLTNYSDFSRDDLPIEDPEWTVHKKFQIHPKIEYCQNGYGFQSSESDIIMKHDPVLFPPHPLCDMNPKFVAKILQYHHRGSHSLFLATDITEKTPELVTYLNAKKVPSPNRNNLHSSQEAVFLDQFLLLHSQFFIQNPLSTFSMNLCIIRAVLGLKTIPVIKDQNIETQDIHGPGVFVSCQSVMDALRDVGGISGLQNIGIK